MSLSFGATAVAVKARDGVVIAADRRMSYGGFILSRNAKKVYKITDRIGMSVTGLYGDVSGLIRIVDAEVRYYENSMGKKITLRAVAKLLSNLLYSYRVSPLYVEAIIGGIDADGAPRIYVLDPVGAITEEEFAATGTGATIALGVIENSYRSDIDLEAAEKLAEDAVKAAIRRDAGSGDAIDVLAISPEGIRERHVRLRVVSG
jgi:proteasome beta subunit